MKRLFFTIFTLISVATLSARPRLVITIAIDGLQNDHLATLANSFERGGFRRLTAGIAIPQAACHYMPNGVAVDYASLVTGSWPCYHGVVADKIYNLVEDKLVPVMYDGRFRGINSPEMVSPKQLACSNLADAIKLNLPQSKNFAIARNATSAVIFGGHAANGVVWIDQETGQLASTNFYEKGLPSWANRVNQTKTIENYLAYEWRPLFEIGTYRNPPIACENGVFSKPNDNSESAEKVYRFIHSPFANTLMKDLAIRAVRDEKLGIDVATDFLMVQFSVKLPHEQGNALLSAEKEDLYIRLDRDLSLLLDAIDLSVGLNNTLVVLTAGKEEPFSLSQISKTAQTAGKFNAKRAMALLNAYLMAIYGQGRFVNDYHARQIYLNKTLIERQKIDLDELEKHVARFMTEFQGVQQAYTSSEIRLAPSCSNDELSKIHNSAYRGTSGDVIFTLKPGWIEIDDRGECVGVTSRSTNSMPVYFSGMALPQKTISSGISIVDIVPTICHWLQIVPPNAAIGTVLSVE